MYTFIYKCVQTTGVICWVEVGSECNVVHRYSYNNFFLILHLNGSVNGLKPRIYYLVTRVCFFDYQLVKALPITGSFNSNRGNDIAFIVAKLVLLMIKAQRLEDEFQIRNTTICYFGCIK